MILTNEQILSIAFGAVEISVEEKGIRFYKCTEKQRKAWYEKREILGDRASGSTGVRLDFHTNSQSFAFAVPYKGKYELYIDGLLRNQVFMNDGEEKRFELSDPLGNKKDSYRVTLYFPSHDVYGAISRVELDDGATFVPHKYDMKWLFIGDSITQGWAALVDSLSYAWRVSRFYNADCVINGVGGAFFHEDTFDTIDFDPDVVSVAYGTNDFGYFKTLDEFRGHTRAYLELVAKEYDGKKIFVISPIWRDKRDGKSMGSFEACRAVVAEEAERLGLIHIDGLYLVPPLPQFYYDEYLHPNENGFSLFAENLITELQKYITRN